MKRTVLPLACVAAFLCCGINAAWSETPLELIERAQKTLQAHVEAAKKEQTAKLEQLAKEAKADGKTRDLEIAARLGEVPEAYALQNAAQVLARIHDALAADEDAELGQILRQLGETNLALPEDVRKDVDAATQMLRKDEADHAQAYVRDVDAACKRASELLVKATEPKELDKTLQELAQLAAKPPGRNRFNGGEGSQSNRLQAAVQFVNRWQDYLLARSQNNEEGQSNALRTLADSNNYNQVALVPRSEILSRLPPKEGGASSGRRPPRSQVQLDAETTSILQAVKTLDDIPAALTKLTDLRKEISSQQSYPYRSDSDLSLALTSLQGFQRSRLELQNGLATSLSLGTVRNGDYNQRPDLENMLFPLRLQLIKLAIPRVLGAPETEKPAENEALDAYLRRMIELAKGRKDWAAVMRGLEVKQSLANTPNAYTVGVTPEMEAFKNFFAGSNLETAGQYEQAVFSYLTALRSGQADLPSSLIGERLAAIEKAHPTEYTSGKDLVSNPRQFYGGPGMMPMPGMIRGGYDPRFQSGRPGFPGQPGSDEKLAVPAASPAPVASPTPSASSTPAHAQGTP